MAHGTESGCGLEHFLLFKPGKWLSLKLGLSSLSDGGRRSLKRLNIGQDESIVGLL